MNKIVVATDLSRNSKAGIRFAIQMAQSGDVELTFLLVYDVLEASIWTAQEYEYLMTECMEKAMKELHPFIKSVYHDMNIKPANYHLAVYPDPDTVAGILDFSEKSKADYICISSRGAGGLKKLFGSNASDLITRSRIPVLCIPNTYRARPIKRILYASDMTNYEEELKAVIDFGRPLHAAVEMLHLTYPFEMIPDRELMEQSLEQKVGYKVDLHFQNRDIERSLMKEITRAIDKSGASVLVMFTQHDRSVFRRIFSPGKTKAYSFYAKIPLLSFTKTPVTGIVTDPEAAARKSKVANDQVHHIQML